MNILIYGTGSAAKKLTDTINKEKCNILAYVDRKVNDIQFIGDVKVIPREEIKNYNFDYIIIASSYKEIYDILVTEYNVPEYSIIPIYYNGKHEGIKNIILDEIIKNRLDDKELYINEICKNYNYFNNKTIAEICRILKREKKGEKVYTLGLANPVVLKLFCEILHSNVEVFHSLDDTFFTEINNDEQKKFYNEILLEFENDIKYSRKNVLRNLECMDNITYRYGFSDELYKQIDGYVDFVYIESGESGNLKSNIEAIYNYVARKGYIFIHNPLTNDRIKNEKLIYYIKSEFNDLVECPLFTDRNSLLFIKS